MEKIKCKKCDFEIDDIKFKVCSSCRQEEQKYRDAVKNERVKKCRELGVCAGNRGRCGKEIEDKKFLLCISCREKCRNDGKRTIKTWKKRNACLNCGHENNTTGKHCSNCLDKYSKKRKRLKEKNLCTGCWKENDRKNSCHCCACFEKYKQPRVEQVEKCIELGICTSRIGCTNKSISKNKNPLCFECWVQSFSNRHKTNVKEIKELWYKQNGKCFYTDIELIPGKTASIDHITPIARGGNNNIGNLRWVSHRVNTMKNDLTHDEFINFCKLLSDKFK